MSPTYSGFENSSADHFNNSTKQYSVDEENSTIASPDCDSFPNASFNRMRSVKDSQGSNITPTSPYFGFDCFNYQQPQYFHPLSGFNNSVDNQRYFPKVPRTGKTQFTWSGILPSISYKNVVYSPKVFLGGLPWDINEQALVQIFKQFGPIRVEWPGKEQQGRSPKGYVYIIFETEKQVKALLHSCTQTDSRTRGSSSHRNYSNDGNGNYYYKISSKKIRAKEVEVIPWIIADSNYVKAPSQKLDATKTVFVGALHGKLTADGLAKIMNDLFDGVVYAGIDTDKYKYPIGSGRVTFNNFNSYMKAVSAAFIDVKTFKFSKKIQVDPYLEDSICSMCNIQHGPYYCRELLCFK